MDCQTLKSILIRPFLFISPPFSQKIWVKSFSHNKKWHWHKNINWKIIEYMFPCISSSYRFVFLVQKARVDLSQNKSFLWKWPLRRSTFLREKLSTLSHYGIWQALKTFCRLSINARTLHGCAYWQFWGVLRAASALCTRAPRSEGPVDA